MMTMIIIIIVVVIVSFLKKRTLELFRLEKAFAVIESNENKEQEACQWERICRTCRGLQQKKIPWER